MKNVRRLLYELQKTNLPDKTLVGEIWDPENYPKINAIGVLIDKSVGEKTV